MKKLMALAVAMTAAGILVVHAQNEDATSLVKSAQAAVRKANYAEADVLYARAAALGDTPEAAPALLYLGVRALGSNNPLAAQGFFERVLKIDPRGPQAGSALAWLAGMRWSDDPAGAESLYKQALDVENPNSVEAVDVLRKYSMFLRRQGRSEEAAAQEQRARATQSATRGGAGSDLPAGVFRAGGRVLAPSLVSKTEPQYTEEARGGRIQGTTVLQVDIGPDGRAFNFEVIRSLEPGLDRKAIEAVEQWRFKPGAKDGAPVTVRATIEVNFRLL
jgi:TonB family protein